MSETRREREAPVDSNPGPEPARGGRRQRTPFGRRMRNYFLTGLVVLLPAVILFDLVVTIMAAIKANEGVYYRYPLCIRLIA